MKHSDLLIKNLKSQESSVRDAAAIELMDLGEILAVEPLIQAIQNPENVNRRGTLVYALSAFDCRNYLSLLVKLVLTGNYEVASGAFSIIEESILEKPHLTEIKELLSVVKKSELKIEHNKEGYESLIELAQC
ncbi:MAG: HEAT repeat domain-containing protein [Gammaproteobacteria bacterium]|nr:HEAT repeat domain-containing protein [Gammaproteobacteria bacterium]